jgi:hypothetical protein
MKIAGATNDAISSALVSIFIAYHTPLARQAWALRA